MKVILRSLGWIAGVGMVILPAVLLAGYLWLRTSLPDTAGVIAVPGLAAPAEILRDRDGIVHIRAETAAAAYFALGFAHAQDRLWQMEANRRFGAGRLAELAGSRFLPRDRYVRTLGLYRLAEESLGRLSAEAREALEAYTRGVNAFLETRSGALPPEFALIGLDPEPWRPADSVVWGRLMAMNLAGNWRDELLRARLARRLPREVVAALWPPYPEDAPVSVPDTARRTEGAPAPGADPSGTARATAIPDPELAPLFDALAGALPSAPPSRGASNSWVVSGSRTRTGQPILANDPHLRFRAPNLWYLARLTAPGLDIAGATVPGVPFHVLGHNGRIAWGMTTTGADTQDLVIERTESGDPGRYRTPGGPESFRVREETIAVRGGEAVTVSIRRTRNGPVISDIPGRHLSAIDPKSVVALRAAALAEDDMTAEAMFRINRARNWVDFTRALAMFHSPVQNFAYADTDGHIGFAVAGRIPVRRQGDGFAPVPGESAAFEWAGFIPAEDLPQAFDPDSGYIANANNRVAGPAYPYFLARDWESPYRARRIEQVLSTSARHDAAASAALQMDGLSLAARHLLPLMVPFTARDDSTAWALDRLSAWDGVVRREAIEPLLFTAWMRALVQVLFADELGDAFPDFWQLRPQLVRVALETETGWCDDQATVVREPCSTALHQALREAISDLEDRLGPDRSSWRWGAVHRATFSNPALSWIPLLDEFADIVVATDGDDFTVNRGTSRIGSTHDPFGHVHGATYRAIYDLSDLDRSLFIHPTGQSGNPLSDHYRDFATRWRDGAYLTLPASPEGPLERLRLVPRVSAEGP